MSGRKLAEATISKLIKGRKFTYQQWTGHAFARLKFASSTEKGNVGEDFLAKMITAHGYSDVDVVKGRRGQHDVCVRNGDRDVRFEVKVATRDVNGGFQFNGIRYDTRYTHLFFLGIAPDAIYYEIVPKGKIGSEGYTMVAMQKRTNATFKITRPEKGLRGFDDFEADVRRLLGEATP